MNWHLRHRWEPTAKHNGDYAIGGGSATVILLRCAVCGAVETRTIDGHWTREELGMDPLKAGDDDWEDVRARGLAW